MGILWKKILAIGKNFPFRVVLSRPYRFVGEMHDFWEIVLVKSGSLWVAEEQKIQNLKKNMFIVHKPMAFHRLWCAGSDVCAKFISFEAMGTMLKKLECLSGSCPWQLAERFAQTVDMAGNLLLGETALDGELASNCPCSEYERFVESPYVTMGVSECGKNVGSGEDLAARVKTRLASILGELTELKCGEEEPGEMSDVARILAIVDEHYLEELTMEKLAFYCRMSESKIKKEFHSIYDGGVMKYICRLKMRDAAAMIERGMTADQICEALCIRDKNYFSFVFKREIGITPSEYRKTHSE